MKLKMILLLVSPMIIGLAAGCRKRAQETTPAPVKEVSLFAKWTCVKDSTISFKSGNKVGTQVVPRKWGEYMQFNTDGSGKTDYTTFSYVLIENRMSIKYIGGYSSFAGIIEEMTAERLMIRYDFTTKDNNGLADGNVMYAFLSK